SGDTMLTYVDYAFFDPSRPGVPGEPGLRVDQEAIWSAIDIQVRTTCGEQPEDDTGESAEYRMWAACAQPIQEKGERSAVQASRIVPRSAWGDFAALDIAMSALLGGGALLLTWPVVARRRPG
ncbi:MAG: hypothetical protein ABWZ82_11960, partial [Candidatus Limnocylindrales bacterium]